MYTYCTICDNIYGVCQCMLTNTLISVHKIIRNTRTIRMKEKLHSICNPLFNAKLLRKITGPCFVLDVRANY